MYNGLTLGSNTTLRGRYYIAMALLTEMVANTNGDVAWVSLASRRKSAWEDFG